CAPAIPRAGVTSTSSGIPPGQHRLAAEGVVDGAVFEELLDPAQAYVARGQEVVVGQAVLDVSGGKLIDSGLDGPAEPQVGEGVVELGEVHPVVAQVRP